VTSPIGDYLVESLVALFVIVALGALLVYAARRTGLGFARGLGSIELLARVPLEPRRSIYVVRVVDQVLILGASEGGITKLGELPESAIAALRAPQPSAGFAEALKTALGRPPSGGSR
jgi:flagellar protein FliO/FliZ